MGGKNNLIKVISSFIQITAREEEIIDGLFTTLNLGSGEYFLEQGKICRHVGFIEKGLVRYFINVDGTEKTIYFNKENEFTCNYQSFLPRIASNTNIQAVEESVLRVISFENLQRLYSDVKEGDKLGRLVIGYVFLSAMEQLKSFYTDSPKERYEQFLNSYPDLAQRIPQYYIASYVGIKPQSLSRIRKRLAAQK
jgi:CRP-like cAMP-binding protein